MPGRFGWLTLLAIYLATLIVVLYLATPPT